MGQPHRDRFRLGELRAVGRAFPLRGSFVISDDGYIEILSGIRQGESVVSSPYQAISKQLKNGAQVIVEDPQARKDRYRQMRQAQ